MRESKRKFMPVQRRLERETMLAMALLCLGHVGVGAQEAQSPDPQPLMGPAPGAEDQRTAADLAPVFDMLLSADDSDKPKPPAPPPPLPPGTHPDIVKIIEVKGRNPGGVSWMDSYSVGDRCYCNTNFDHGIGTVEVDTPVGVRTIVQICEAIGPGPGRSGRPIYNDIQCGNGPANTASDETDCPGRVDIGPDGCGHIGPKWDLSNLE